MIMIVSNRCVFMHLPLTTMRIKVAASKIKNQNALQVYVYLWPIYDGSCACMHKLPQRAPVSVAKLRWRCLQCVSDDVQLECVNSGRLVPWLICVLWRSEILNGTCRYVCAYCIEGLNSKGITHRYRAMGLFPEWLVFALRPQSIKAASVADKQTHGP